MNDQTPCSAVVDETVIIIRRIVEAPRELVFQAWTDPSRVERWWGPSGYASYDCNMELRTNGCFQLKMKAPDGTVYPCEGVIREIVAPRRIVFEGIRHADHPCGSGIPPRSIMTVTFEEVEQSRTELTIHTRLENSADCQAVVDAGFDPGWNQTLDRLAKNL